MKRKKERKRHRNMVASGFIFLKTCLKKQKQTQLMFLSFFRVPDL